jgi:N utilization substance protein A
MSQGFSITGGTEILQVADAVAKEKGLPKEIIISALEESILAVAKRKYGSEHNIKAKVDQRNGEITILKERSVVKTIEDYESEIDLDDAKKINPQAKIGETVVEQLPPVEFGRVNSATFKSVLTTKIMEAERDREFEEFKDRVGEIITGAVKRIDYGNIYIDFGKSETVLLKEETIQRENFRNNDRIRAYIYDVRKEAKGPQIFLSRRHPNFLAELFRQEVPEIYDGIVQIKGVVRDAGSRAKIAVASTDQSTDPVGACIGPRGSRVSSIYNELQGEKIDIVEWSPDIAKFAVNALSSKSKDNMVQVTKIVIDEEKNLIEAVVPDDQKSLAIGRRGQNVKLASELVGWEIDVLGESEYSERSTDEFNKASQLFTEQLNVEPVIGQLLASEGFKTVEEVAFVEIKELMSIEGFDKDLAEELQKRAKAKIVLDQKEEAEETEKA